LEPIANKEEKPGITESREFLKQKDLTTESVGAQKSIQYHETIGPLGKNL